MPKALITGASTGIGAVYADRLARRGHDLVLVARDRARLEALAAKLRAETGVAVTVIPADLNAHDDLVRVAALLRDDATIGVFVNNAGMATPGPTTAADPDKVEAMLLLNVVAATRLASAAGAAFAARKAGTIINLASIVALAVHAISPGYSGSKAYMLNFSLMLERELAPAGVRVQTVLPGATRTEIWGRGGIDVATLPSEILMDVDDMVDASLAGLDQGETVTIPALADPSLFGALEAAREALRPHLSRSAPAPRYGVTRATVPA